MLEKNNFLGEEKVGKLLAKFSLPCIFSLLVSALYNIVDQIFIGNSELGYLGNAATGIVFPILIITLAFAWCFGDGAAAYLSICQGRRDTVNAHKSIGTGMVVTVIVSIILAVLFGVFKEGLLRLFGASDATIGMASDYFIILVYALPIYMLSNMMTSVIRADGSPRYAMITTVVGAVINIILDPIFIFAFKWGIKGAAYATVIGQAVTFILSLIYFWRTKTFKLVLSSFIPNFKIFANAVKLGISTFITQMSIVVIALVCNMMLFKYGALSEYGPDIPISAISIETKVFTIVINLVVGLILGGQPILGYNYGAKRFDRVKETYKKVLTTTIIIGFVSTLIFEFFPELIIGIFGKGTPLYQEFAIKTFRIFLSLVTFTCIIKMTSIFFQAVGQPIKAAVVSLTRDIICFIPLVILLPLSFGIDGVLYAAPIADLIGIIITLILTVDFFKKLNRAATPLSSAKDESVIKKSVPGVIVAISREHGSQGKQIGKILADKMNVPCYYKELTAIAATESGIDKEFISGINENTPSMLRQLYLSGDVIGQAVLAEVQVINKIADNGSAVIIGRAADYVLKDRKNLVKVFIYANKDYRIKKVCEMYNDTPTEAANYVKRSDENRASFYKHVTNLTWGDKNNYDLMIDSSIGVEQVANVILSYVTNKK